MNQVKQVVLRYMMFFIHCLAAMNLKAGVQQQFNCLVNQNRQAMHSMTLGSGEADRLDSGGQRGQWSVLLLHTHKLQRGPYHTCVSRSRNA